MECFFFHVPLRKCVHLDANWYFQRIIGERRNDGIHWSCRAHRLLSYVLLSFLKNLISRHELDGKSFNLDRIRHDNNFEEMQTVQVDDNRDVNQDWANAKFSSDRAEKELQFVQNVRKYRFLLKK